MGQQKKGPYEAVGCVLRFVEKQTCVRRVRSSLYRWPLGEWFCKPWCVHRVCSSFRNHSESGSSGLARVAEARVGFVLPMLWGEAEARGPKPLLGLCDPCGLSLTARPREGPRVLVWVNDVVLVNETRPGARGRFASRHNTVRDGRRGGGLEAQPRPVWCPEAAIALAR